MTSASASAPIPEPISARTAPSRVAPYAWLTVFGLGVAAIGPALFMAANGEVDVLAVALLLLPLVAAVLVARFGTWARTVAAIVSVLLLLMIMPFVGSIITHVNVFFEFVPVVILIVGSLVGAVAAVLSVAKRRGSGAATRATERRVATWVGLLLLVVAAVSTVASVTSRTEVGAADRAGAVAVEQSRFAFAQTEYVVPADVASRLVVHNSDRVHHTVTNDDLGIDETVLPGSDVLVELPALAPGSYTFYCVPHSNRSDGLGEDDMFMTLRVE